MPPRGWTRTTEGVESVFSPTTRELNQSVHLQSLRMYLSADTCADLGAKHAIGAPIHVYPLYENGYRARRGQSIYDNNLESAQLYAEFARVAEAHTSAWSYGKAMETAESIGQITKRNRMICFPCEYGPALYPTLPFHRKLSSYQCYAGTTMLTLTSDPLLMNAFNTVNLAAACVLTSKEYAREIGIPESKWIYPLGGAGTSESADCRSTPAACY